MTEKTRICPECDNTNFKDNRCTQCFHQIEPGKPENPKGNGNKK